MDSKVHNSAEQTLPTVNIIKLCGVCLMCALCERVACTYTNCNVVYACCDVCSPALHCVCSADPTVLREKINFQHFACVMARFRRIKQGEATEAGYNSVDQKVECELHTCRTNRIDPSPGPLTIKC